MRLTLAQIIAELPYLSLQDRGRLRFALAQPVPAIAQDEPKPVKVPVDDAAYRVIVKSVNLREKAPPNSGE